MARKEEEYMTTICFVGPYRPIMCGIAEYTNFIVRELPTTAWKALSFDLENYGAPLISEDGAPPDQVWYGMPERHEVSREILMTGLRELGTTNDTTVLWFQHETAIWPDRQRFADMLKRLKMPKIVTFHTLHFESAETTSGLRRSQYNLLKDILPHVEAITVFSHGVYQAVTMAFPEYREKVYIMRHGIHSHPEIARLSREEAKEKLNDFLLYESDLDRATKEALHRQRILLAPDTFVMGETGFLCPMKQSELLYSVRDILQRKVPQKRIAAIRIGQPRDSEQKSYAEDLNGKQDYADALLLETWMPENMLRVAQKAFDVNFYWPRECTQSGIIAHALGVGAVIAGRNLEGSGETLWRAGAIVDADLDFVVAKIKNLIVNPEIGTRIEGIALGYAAEFSWENQARRHCELAERISRCLPQSLTLCSYQQPEVPYWQAIEPGLEIYSESN